MEAPLGDEPPFYLDPEMNYEGTPNSVVLPSYRVFSRYTLKCFPTSTAEFVMTDIPDRIMLIKVDALYHELKWRVGEIRLTYSEHIEQLRQLNVIGEDIRRAQQVSGTISIKSFEYLMSLVKTYREFVAEG